MVPGYVRYTEIYDGIVSVLSKVRMLRRKRTTCCCF
jgi:hypothetical protein